MSVSPYSDLALILIFEPVADPIGCSDLKAGLEESPLRTVFKFQRGEVALVCPLLNVYAES